MNYEIAKVLYAYILIESVEGKFTKFRMLTKYRILACLNNDEPLCGLWPHYKLMGRFAAFGSIIN